MPAATVLDPTRPVVEQLRARVRAMETSVAPGSGAGSPAGLPVPTLPALTDALSVLPGGGLRTGAAYGVDSASLALALAAGASAAGEWVGFAGWPDFGAEAAADLGIDLDRTVLVPELGDHWLEVTAALVEVLRVVVLCPPTTVERRAAGVIEARLRSRSTALVVWGAWPGCAARLGLETTAWSGPRSGHGRLERRRVTLAVRRGGGARPHRVDLWFPGTGHAVEVAEPAAHDAGLRLTGSG